MDIGQFFKNLIAGIYSLFGMSPSKPSNPPVPTPAPSPTPPPPVPIPTPTPTPPPQPVGPAPAPQNIKVMLIIYNPRVPSEQNRKLTDVLGWSDPDALVQGFIADVKDCSHGYAKFQVVNRVEVDRLPIKEDGFAYSPDDYVRFWRAGSGFHSPDMANYALIFNDFNLVGRINSGEIDEVWLMAGPYAGFRESRMAGPGAFFCNGEVIENVPSNRRFVVMGFNYQRGVGEMFESLAHRAESIIEHVFRNTPPTENLWQRFTRYDKLSPGNSEVGSVHFAPNSQKDYDWGNSTYVPARCNNWMNFPDLSGSPVSVNCSEWGGGDTRLHHMWWLGHFPHITGEANGIAYNWWQYVVIPDLVL